MQFSSIIPRMAATTGCALLLFACAPPAEEAAETEEVSATDQAAAVDGQSEDAAADGLPAGSAPAQMPSMSQTGWRVRGEDGAVYTTYLDAGGSYRDFKNGDPLQTGTWEERVDGKLCFTPEEEGRIGECWALAPLDSDGMMQPVSDAGKSIDLREVTYLPPEDEG